MMTNWHKEDYRVPSRWKGTKTRSRVVNARGKVMISDLDPVTAAAVVAEHNLVVAAIVARYPDEYPNGPEGDSKTPDAVDPSPHSRMD